MSRLDNIKKYKAKLEAEEVAKANEEELERNKLVKAILELSPRVKELVSTANACVANGIPINHKDLWGGSQHPNDFMADGVHHRIGFNIIGGCNNEKIPITDIRICAGGICGSLGISTNGDEVYSVHEKEDYSDPSKVKRYEPRISYMKRLLNEFDDFEKRFYEYVDKTTG